MIFIDVKKDDPACSMYDQNNVLKLDRAILSLQFLGIDGVSLLAKVKFSAKVTP